MSDLIQKPVAERPSGPLATVFTIFGQQTVVVDTKGRCFRVVEGRWYRLKAEADDDF